MSTALRIVNGEILINLTASNSFKEMKDELAKKLPLLDSQQPGGCVSIQIGENQLNNKQIKEIEKILLEYGFNLGHLLSAATGQEPSDSQNGPFSEMPYYKETVLICRNLRSGQKYFAEGNVVVLGDINPGAEVIAGGNILVMGSLRGLAHAGAFGDQRAVIAAFRLNPTQIRIAHHITRPPDGEVQVVKSPEIAQIREGKVVIRQIKI
ncbi:MAG: septum site-determining protein MinC [Syntrophomonadaceae bacterium]|jgi:septum site-determining protein MinC